MQRWVIANVRINMEWLRATICPERHVTVPEFSVHVLGILDAFECIVFHCLITL